MLLKWFLLWVSAIFIILLAWLKVLIIITNTRELILENPWILVNPSDLITMNVLIKHNLKLIFSRLRIFILFMILSKRFFLRRRIATIKSQRKRIIQHLWNNIAKNRRWQLKTWICIHLNKITFQVLVNHNIQSKNLKIAWPSTRINKVICCVNNISWNVSYLWQDSVKKRDFLLIFIIFTLIFSLCILCAFLFHILIKLLVR